jgi:hypothetical protein
MMEMSQPPLQDYWIPQPLIEFGESERRACDLLLASALAQGPDQPFDYSLPIPKWRFLCYVAEEHGLALHGSHNGEIVRFEPRQTRDMEAFGAQKAVYAAADGIWPMYFAIVDRTKSPSLINGCLRLEEKDGSLGRPHYFFSISEQAQGHDPYHEGVIYLLPRDTFIQQPPLQRDALRVHVAQLASPVEVVPLAKLVIMPEDFPFLAQMHTHEDARLAEYAAAMSGGLPWPE